MNVRNEINEILGGAVQIDFRSINQYTLQQRWSVNDSPTWFIVLTCKFLFYTTKNRTQKLLVEWEHDVNFYFVNL